MPYNGWANYETWNVALWIDNEEPIYREKIRFLRHKDSLDADEIEAFCRDMFPEGTPDFDSVKDFAKVDWQEIADNWSDELSENVA